MAEAVRERAQDYSGKQYDGDWSSHYTHNETKQTRARELLAREAGLHYQSIAMSTDYDCWKEDEEPVTWEMIVERMQENSDNVIKLLLAAIPEAAGADCACLS